MEKHTLTRNPDDLHQTKRVKKNSRSVGVFLVSRHHKKWKKRYKLNAGSTLANSHYSDYTKVEIANARSEDKWKNGPSLNNCAPTNT